jgi:hypothetical protein
MLFVTKSFTADVHHLLEDTQTLPVSRDLLPVGVLFDISLTG